MIRRHFFSCLARRVILRSSVVLTALSSFLQLIWQQGQVPAEVPGSHPAVHHPGGGSLHWQGSQGLGQKHVSHNSLKIDWLLMLVQRFSNMCDWYAGFICLMESPQTAWTTTGWPMSLFTRWDKNNDEDVTGKVLYCTPTRCCEGWVCFVLA